jgi:hypothetical protein
VAAAAGVSAAGVPVGDRAGQGEADAGEAGGDLGGDLGGAGLLVRGGVTAYIGRWRPSSVSPLAAAFARDVIGQVAPRGRERAKNLMWAAGKLADYAAGLGLDLIPGVVLHPSVTDRFTRCAPGLSGVARRTLRTNLRFIGRRVVPQLSRGPAATPGTC